mgnify:FL=1
MNNIDFSQILEQVCMEEYTVKDNVLEHRFSFRHRKNMKQILGISYSCPKPEKKYKLSRRTLCIIIAAIFLAALAVTGSAFYIRTFIMREHRDNTQLFAIDVQGSPELLEQKYFISVLPEGYKEIDRFVDDYSLNIIYQNCNGTDHIVFYQDVKRYYSRHYNTEGYDFEGINIGEYSGLYIDWSDENTNYGSVIWANGEYIFEIIGNLAKNELLNLAKHTNLLKK